MCDSKKRIWHRFYFFCSIVSKFNQNQVEKSVFFLGMKINDENKHIFFCKKLFSDA